MKKKETQQKNKNKIWWFQAVLPGLHILICSLNVVYYYCHSQFQVIVPSVVIYYLNIIYIMKYIFNHTIANEL
jgi:hypothetical protein